MDTLNDCKPPETALEATVLAIDKFIISRVGITRPKAYGLAQRYIDKGKSIYLADNGLHIEEGEFATWDDRFDACWFHVCTGQTVDNSKGFGKSAGIKQTSAMSLIAWAKRKTLDANGTQTTTQLGLSERFGISINQGSAGTGALTSVELDMPTIESAYFVPNRISKESLLFKINYNLIINVTPACLPVLCEPETC